MLAPRDSDPSPFRSGLIHGVFSLAVFGGAFGLLGGVIHLTGEPKDAGPTHVIALFDTAGEGEVPLRTRYAASVRGPAVTIDTDPATQAAPSLGVADPDTAPAPVDEPRVQQAAAEPTRRGIRINGKLVNPGERFSAVDAVRTETAAAPTPAPEPVAASARPASDRADNAHPFSNPEGLPVVSLIVGGLGTSRRQTLIAIDDLPSEVTLSFDPRTDQRVLREIMTYARRKGHEVLLEIPMESHGQSRARPHRLTLQASAPAQDNIERLDGLLRGQGQLIGVINYQGEKLMARAAAVAPILEHLDGLGLTFFQHGSAVRGEFGPEAARLGTRYAAAGENIDTELQARQIREALFRLETEARENGHALGTGFVYPLTVDVVAEWSQDLRAKGLILAPASHVAKIRTTDAAPRRETRLSQLTVSDPGAVQP